MQEVKLYTDGACSGNPGPGGCSAILTFGENRKQLSAGYKLTTNNRMELRAVIMGLEAMKKRDVKVIIYSDSKYVINSFDKGWIYNWEKEKFYKRTNADLFIKLLELYRSFAVIEFIWVKGHSGHDENENCDSLAVSMSLSRSQTEDVGYNPQQ
jgi:ribonuclease HI